MMFWTIPLIFLVITIYYLYLRLSRGITRSATCLVGKTAIITGANSGIGYQTALNLASRGCKIIMADVANMEKSRKNIIKYSNNPNIIAKHLDLASLKSVREFASEINKNEERLDILINNAGVGLHTEKLTPDGLNSVMQINYFGHFLLTHLLIDLLKKSAPSRIIFHSSVSVFWHNLSVDNINNTEDLPLLTNFRYYGGSKFAMLIASDIFAQKLKGTGVTSNTVHCGIANTQIFRKSIDIVDNSLLQNFRKLFLWIHAKDPWEAAQVVVHVAVSKKLEKVTGEYFWDCRPFIKPPAAKDEEFCKKIWEASEEYVQLKDEEKLCDSLTPIGVK